MIRSNPGGRLIPWAYDDGFASDGVSSRLVLRVVQHRRVGRERYDLSSGFQSGNRGKRDRVKAAPQVDVDEIDTGIFNLRQKKR